MICQICNQPINHNAGDGVLTIRLGARMFRVTYCARCALSTLIEGIKAGME